MMCFKRFLKEMSVTLLYLENPSPRLFCSVTSRGLKKILIDYPSWKNLINNLKRCTFFLLYAKYSRHHKNDGPNTLLPTGQ